MKRSVALVTTLITSVLLIHPSPAQAYLDPLTGGLFFQIVSFIFVSLLTAFYFIGDKVRRFFSWIKALFSGVSNKKS